MLKVRSFAEKMCIEILGFQAKLEAVPIKNNTMNERLHA
jgi:hypothetical protein